MKNLQKIFKFEQMSLDYIDEQMESLIRELTEKPREYQDENYIQEKINNARNQFNQVLDNFARRIKIKEIREEFIQKQNEAN